MKKNGGVQISTDALVVLMIGLVVLAWLYTRNRTAIAGSPPLQLIDTQNQINQVKRLI